MHFGFERSLTGGASSDPDPRGSAATIASIPDAALMEIPPTQRNTDAPPWRLALALDGTAGNTAVVQVWTLVETAPVGVYQPPLTVAQRGARDFHLAIPATTITVGTLAEVFEAMPGPGKIYLRVTTFPAANGVLYAAALA